MSKINYSKLENSIKNLKEKYEYFLKEKENMNKMIKESFETALIKSFEICFEMSYKHLSKYLENSGLSDFVKTPKGIFRKAFEIKIIEDIDLWIDYVNKRNEAAHDYNFEKRDIIIDILKDFIRDTQNVLEKLKKDE